MPDLVQGILIGGAIGVVMTIVELQIWSMIFKLVPPWQRLILSGKRYMVNGRTLSYRVVEGGTAKTPLIEQAATLDISLMSELITVRGVYARGGVPATIIASALFRVAPDAPHIHNAVERFLGQDKQHISTVVRETLEGHIRAITAETDLAQLDPLQMEQAIFQAAGEDMNKLGISLLTMTLRSAKAEV